MENWPKNNMDLSNLGNDLSKRVEIQNSGILEQDFYRYANNFYEAGTMILQDAINSLDTLKLDSCYFSLIYLYRQSLELMLKANIFKFVKSDSDRVNVLRIVRHDVKSAFDILISTITFLIFPASFISLIPANISFSSWLNAR